jgi:hypothetical protein
MAPELNFLKQRPDAVDALIETLRQLGRSACSIWISVSGAGYV